MEKYQPELYELWKMGIQVNKNENGDHHLNHATNGGGEASNQQQQRRKRSLPQPAADIQVVASAAKRVKGEQSSGNGEEQRLSPSRASIETYVREVRLRYASLEFSSYDDRAQRRHQIDVRNIALADESSRLDHLAYVDIDAARKSLATNSSNSSSRVVANLVKIALAKLVSPIRVS